MASLLVVIQVHVCHVICNILGALLVIHGLFLRGLVCLMKVLGIIQFCCFLHILELPFLVLLILFDRLLLGRMRLIFVFQSAKLFD